MIAYAVKEALIYSGVQQSVVAECAAMNRSVLA